MRRVAVGGETSAGKTTFARALASRLDVPAIELDALFWGPNWTKPAPDVFRARVAEQIAQEAWVVDGNYSATRDLVWARADTVIWLDPPFRVLLWRLFLRTNRRIWSREELWTGSRNTPIWSCIASETRAPRSGGCARWPVRGSGTYR